jgi:hypothetical protein
VVFADVNKQIVVNANSVIGKASIIVLIPPFIESPVKAYSSSDDNGSSAGDGRAFLQTDAGKVDVFAGTIDAKAFRVRREINRSIGIPSLGHLRLDPIPRNPRNSAAIPTVSRNRIKTNLTRSWTPSNRFISRRTLMRPSVMSGDARLRGYGYNDAQGRDCFAGWLGRED